MAAPPPAASEPASAPTLTCCAPTLPGRSAASSRRRPASVDRCPRRSSNSRWMARRPIFFRPMRSISSARWPSPRRRRSCRHSFPRRPGSGARWGMVIDTSLCIGCNACVVACQVENNSPVIGPDEIAAGRDMHWLRIDAYEIGSPENPRTGFQPVPCMHCETAPCEPVCPTGASVHDSEGLNVQVYNRCIGTRFCEANCPYKVRRFNFFGYADGQEYRDLGADVMRAHNNPDVTVRSRGVMEKCTYCVQRISRARHAADKEDRLIVGRRGRHGLPVGMPDARDKFRRSLAARGERVRHCGRSRITTACSAISIPSRARPIWRKSATSTRNPTGKTDEFRDLVSARRGSGGGTPASPPPPRRPRSPR